MATQSAAARAPENDARAGEQSDDDVMECAAPPEAVKAKGSSSATSDVWLYFDRGARKGGTVPCKKCKKLLASKDDNTSGVFILCILTRKAQRSQFLRLSNFRLRKGATRGGSSRISATPLILSRICVRTRYPSPRCRAERAPDVHLSRARRCHSGISSPANAAFSAKLRPAGRARRAGWAGGRKSRSTGHVRVIATSSFEINLFDQRASPPKSNDPYIHM